MQDQYLNIYVYNYNVYLENILCFIETNKTKHRKRKFYLQVNIS
jgi:hypothetical protein